jgi:hypothetical protein
MKYRILGIVVAISLCLSIVGAYAATQMLDMPKGTRYHQHLEAAQKPDCEHTDGRFCTHLPLIEINTGGGEIPGKYYLDENGNEQATLSETGENYVLANVNIFDDPAENNHLTDEAEDTGTVQIKVRGNSSRYHDKLGYTLTFVNELGENESHSVMGMDAHHEWVLHGPFLDQTLIRNYMWYNISGEIMDYAPNVRFCEAFLNGEYIGVYVMVETITAGKVKDSRLDLSVQKKDQTFTGYCIRVDRGSTELKNLDVFTNYTLRNKQTIDMVYPGTSNLTPEIKHQIEQDFSHFERILYSFDYKDEQYGYPNFIDVQSFVDYFVINEFTSNYDAGWLSTYVYKDADGLLRLCVWDFNSVFDNYKETPIDPYTFQMNLQPWYVMLIKCPDFTEQIIDRYRELRKTYLSEEYLNRYIDETVSYLGDAIDRNFEKWGYTFEQENGLLWPLDRSPQSYEEALDLMRSYIHMRGEWMDDNIDSLMQFASESKNKKNNESRR